MTERPHMVRVFAAGERGGNPVPIVVDADGMSDAAMRDIARGHRLESGFVQGPSEGCDLTLRFFVPNHEMEMCGHATIGAVWLLERLGRLPGDTIAIATRSGRVEARVMRGGAEPSVEISQPRGTLEVLDPRANAEAISVLGLDAADLAAFPIQNACTSRVKTLIPLASIQKLDSLAPDLDRVETVCERIGSTGLYPFAPIDTVGQVFGARQFPKSSGYPEDAATGIAASALAFGLLSTGRVTADETPIHIRQGMAMGRPSEIMVRFRTQDGEVIGYWIGGKVEVEAA